MFKQNIAKLLDKEMDRKDFLKHVGIAAVAMTGAGAILKTLSQQPTSRTANQAYGYGGSVYGGAVKKSN